MSSVEQQEQQLAKRRLEHERRFKKSRIENLKIERNISDRKLLSEMFSLLKTYKRIDESILYIQSFLRSFRYKIMMKILKKKHQEPNSATHSITEVDRFHTLEADRLTAISQSRDLKNDPLTCIHVILVAFVKTHSPRVDEANFIEYLSEKLSPDEYQYLTRYIGDITFIQFFESTRITRDEIRTQKRMRYYISKLVWILYYMSCKQVTKFLFLDMEIVFNLLQIQIQEFIQEENETIEQSVQYAQSHPYQPEYNQCFGCGTAIPSSTEVYIDGMFFHPACVRPRDNMCASCGHPIGGNAVEVDGMRLHPDCANHNQSNSYFRDYTECSACGCSSNDMTMFEGVGLICDACVHASASASANP